MDFDLAIPMSLDMNGPAVAENDENSSHNSFFNNTENKIGVDFFLVEDYDYENVYACLDQTWP